MTINHLIIRTPGTNSYVSAKSAKSTICEVLGMAQARFAPGSPDLKAEVPTIRPIMLEKWFKTTTYMYHLSCLKEDKNNVNSMMYSSTVQEYIGSPLNVGK